MDDITESIQSTRGSGIACHRRPRQHVANGRKTLKGSSVESNLLSYSGNHLEVIA